MNFYETMRRVSGHEEYTDAECMKFAIDQWGLVCTWLREHEGEITGYFPITYVSREDVEQQGFDVSTVKDHDMRELAEKMGEAYTENGYWEDLSIIAEERLGFAKKLED